MAQYSSRDVFLSLPRFKGAITQRRLRSSLHWVYSIWWVSWGGGFHHSPRNYVEFSHGMVGMCHQSWLHGVSEPWIGVRWNAGFYTYKAADLKPFLVAQFCMTFITCCKCLSMVSRQRPRKQITKSSIKSALKMSLAISEGSALDFSSKHIIARTPPVRQSEHLPPVCQD